jgi:hypothetical protein
MLWYCRFKWYPHTSVTQVRKRVLEQDAAGTNQPEKIKGWYNLAGGGAGFMLVEGEERDVTHLLQPYMDLMSWDVHAAYALDYEKMIADFKQEMG